MFSIYSKYSPDPDPVSASASNAQLSVPVARAQQESKFLGCKPPRDSAWHEISSPYKEGCKQSKSDEIFNLISPLTETRSSQGGILANRFAKMRLLNASTLALEIFFGDSVPKYAILSHRWNEEEVSLQDLQNGKGQEMSGYSKIQRCCAQALSDGWQYAWIDSCCIDKTSSAE